MELPLQNIEQVILNKPLLRFTSLVCYIEFTREYR